MIIVTKFWVNCHQLLIDDVSGSANGAFYDDDQFVLPIKLFIGDYLHRYVCLCFSFAVINIYYSYIIIIIIILL